MTVDEILARKAAIKNEVEQDGADLTALETEVRSLNEQLDAIKAEAEKRQAIRDAVAAGEGVVVEKMEGRKVKNTVETRNTKEYIDAYANYIKTGKDEECRALLSTNGTDAVASLTGYVPVPDLVDARIRTAWEKNNVMNLVRKTYLKGNVKVGFELSATGAVVHQEGTSAPDEEVITLGIVTMVPQSIKKWIECEAA